MTPEPVAVDVPGAGAVPCAWLSPRRPEAVVVLAHGAGAGMDHPFMRAVHAGLAGAGFACATFDFPYMATGRRAPDRAPVLEATWRAVLAAARARHPRLALVAGGKSMGGRIATRVAAAGEAVDGLVLLGYPLHPSGRSERVRCEHFPGVRAPCLFVQGNRDPLCDLARLRAALPSLGAAATLHVVDGGDHSFRVLKRSGVDQDAVDAAVLEVCARWIRELAAGARRR